MFTINLKKEIIKLPDGARRNSCCCLEHDLFDQVPVDQGVGVDKVNVVVFALPNDELAAEKKTNKFYTLICKLWLWNKESICLE